jgi:hypothetical protein
MILWPSDHRPRLTRWSVAAIFTLGALAGMALLRCASELQQHEPPPPSPPPPLLDIETRDPFGIDELPVSASPDAGAIHRTLP